MKRFREFLTWGIKHPYTISFFVALAHMLFILFYASAVEIVTDPEVSETIQILSIDKIAAPRRVVKKQISTEEGDPVEDQTIDRSKGTSLEESAVDMDFYPSIAPPRPAEKLKELYPSIGREEEVEALLNVELVILPNGKVASVKVRGVRLSKSYPPEMRNRLWAAFSAEAVKILLGAKFTPPVIQGKKIPVRMDFPLNFKLRT
ncbi:MAG: hypothetical protein GY754_23315 [bacterium]|nr:hypothetical protein [bacterium]